MKAVAIFISIVVVLLLGAIGATVYVIMQMPPPPPPRIAVVPVEVEPGLVDLGVVSQGGEPISIPVRLVNTGDQAFNLVQVIPACECTVPDLRLPIRLEPGGTTEFVVTLDPWGAVGARSQKVEFIYAESPRSPSFRATYEVKPGLRTVPGAAHRRADDEAVVRVTADDGRRFEIKAIDPPVVRDWVRTPTSDTSLVIDWALVDAAAESHRGRFDFAPDGTWKRGIITITTTREEEPSLHLRVYNRKSPSSGVGLRSPQAEAPSSRGGDATSPAAP